MSAKPELRSLSTRADAPHNFAIAYDSAVTSEQLGTLMVQHLVGDLVSLGSAKFNRVDVGEPTDGDAASSPASKLMVDRPGLRAVWSASPSTNGRVELQYHGSHRLMVKGFVDATADPAGLTMLSRFGLATARRSSITEAAPPASAASDVAS